MPACSRPSLVESLETRRYAASAERVMTTVNDPKPASTILSYRSQNTVNLAELPRVKVAVDAAGTVNVQGRGGDDNIRIRVIQGGLEIRTSTRWSYTYRTNATKPVRETATTTFENVYKFSRREFSSLVINGGRGADSLRFSGVLPFNPAVTSVESTAVTQAFAELPAGQTPSDAAARPGGWLKLVADEKAYADSKPTPDLAVFGDSHAAHLIDWGSQAWIKLRRPAVFGIGGDTTANLLYRIKNGLFDKYRPARLVVSVGTNNFNNPKTGGTDEQIYQGVLKVMSELRRKLPQSKLVLISLLPRAGMGLNARVEALNARLDAAAKPDGFTFLNLYARFSNPTKVINRDANFRFQINPFGNDSHYNAKGYVILGNALASLLKIGPQSA